MRHLTVSAILLVLLTNAAESAVLFQTWGTPTNIEYVYGASGLVNHIRVDMVNADGTGVYLLTCRRPLLGPCTNLSLGVCYQFDGELWLTYTYPNLCGEAVIRSAVPQPC